KMVATLRPMARASGTRTACTWVASSRVGTSTRPRGRHAIVYPPASRATSGMLNPRVLPEPVWARPRMSKPARASGSVAAWTGYGTVMPSWPRAATSGAGTPSSANVPRDFSAGDFSAGDFSAGDFSAGDFSAGRAVKIDLQDLCGRVVEGATSVETSSLTERQTTGVPPWQRLTA